MADVSWQIRGDYLLACNCDWGCPCNFNAPPTTGFCQATLGVVVEEGRYGEVDLAGCKGFLSAAWPGAIHEGNGTASVYVDAPTESQREGLAQIVSGAAGGAPFAIFGSTFSSVSGPHFVPIRATVSGQTSEVEVEERFHFRFQPIRNPVTKAEVFPRVQLPQGLAFKEGDQYALEQYWVSDGPELNFAHPGKCAEHARVQWSNA